MSAQEFIANSSFRRWVYRPTDADTAQWTSWLAEHPDDQASMEQARDFLLRARGDLPYLSDAFVSERIDRLMAAAGETSQRPALIRPLIGWRLAGMAASVLLVLVGGLWGWQQWRAHQAAALATLVRQPANPLVVVVNRQATARLVQLPDGSLVRLQPSAGVRYRQRNTGPQREVQLTGTAFFEVVKNPAKPFFVHANGLTARVIGTSFTVQAPRAGQPTRILVRTGRVAVYPSNHPEQAGGRSPVVLTANQTATYSPAVNRIDPAPATPAQQLALPMPPTAFVFRRTPLAQVFQALERAYGVRIEYDKARLGQRTLTARLDDESLFDKLSIIAASLDLSYQLTPAGTIEISASADALGKTGY